MGAARQAVSGTSLGLFRCGAAFDGVIVGEPVQTINVATDNLLLRYLKLRENPHHRWLCGLQQGVAGLFAQTRDVTFSTKVSFVRPPNASDCFTFVRCTNHTHAAQIVISRYKHAQVCRRACVTLRGIRFRLLHPHTR
ncbi:hypothetical protein ACS15_5089 [Ralstonia insidiosa]|uniref:Uncharacterized protein n=1 Tax=Ralstonia insidiosa TaxID=190721 RepID=A0AAC9BMK2_9RALS|nr:hypothetical protein ACS15_5089 [Ralstonia insidiosa]